MAKAVTTDPAWFNKLAPVDRTSARKMLLQFNESTMLRVLAAMKPDGKKGRKGKATPEDWVRVALEAFLSLEGMTVGRAAGIAATAVQTAGNLEETRENILRKISKALKAFNLDDLRLNDLQPLFPVVDKMRKAGKHVRTDIFPLTPQIINSAMSSLQAHSDGWKKVASSIEHLNAVMSRFNGSIRPSAAEEFMKMQERFSPSEEERLRQSRVVAFYEAFEHLISSEAPFYVAVRLYDQVEEFVRQEMTAYATSAGNP